MVGLVVGVVGGVVFEFDFFFVNFGVDLFGVGFCFGVDVDMFDWYCFFCDYGVFFGEDDFVFFFVDVGVVESVVDVFVSDWFLFEVNFFVVDGDGDGFLFGDDVFVEVGLIGFDLFGVDV